MSAHTRQESIPVGCVPPAFAVPGGMMSLPVWFHVIFCGGGWVWFRRSKAQPLPYEQQTGVKTLPSRNFVCGR